MRLEEGIWILPLRGRLAGLQRLVTAVKETDPFIRVVAVVDSEDEDRAELKRICHAAGWMVRTYPGSPDTVTKINHAVELFPDEGFYGFLASDVTPLTRDWGKALARCCPEFGLSYCDDSFHGIGLPTHPVVGGELVRALGWWAYPESKHNGIDVCLAQIATKFGGCIYLDAFKFHHFHHLCDKTPADELNVRAMKWRAEDDAAYMKWLAHDFEAAVTRVEAVK